MEHARRHLASEWSIVIELDSRLQENLVRKNELIQPNLQLEKIGRCVEGSATELKASSKWLLPVWKFDGFHWATYGKASVQVKESLEPCWMRSVCGL